jgi:chromosome segregation ATPase
VDPSHVMMASEDNEPAKLTEEMRAEINPESIDDMVKPLEPADIVSPETVQMEYEETESATEPEESDYIETAKTEEIKPDQKKITKPKRKISNYIDSEPKSLPKLHEELRKHSDSVRKTDTTIGDIQRKIKELDKRTSTKQHQIIRDLQTQVNELQRKIDRIERLSRSKSATSIKKTSSKKNKSKSKKSAKKKTRRR